MSKNKQIERISCGFYENTAFDEQLLDVINKITPNPRHRGQKIKELAWEYIKQNMPNEITSLSELKENKSSEPVIKEVKEEKKSQSTNMFTKKNMATR